ncbi:MAG: choice-of-anchor K domain-containing protein [Verrucomicrobiota bacterium]
MKTYPVSSRSGFSFTQVLVAVAIMTVIATGAFRAMSSTAERAEESKLESDVKSVNAALNVYETFGGKIPDNASPGQVIGHLKSKSSATTREQTNGVTGSLVDPRMRALLMVEAEGEEGGGEQANVGAAHGDRPVPRAVWNSSTKRFEVKTSGTGVVKFVIDDRLGDAEIEFEDRHQNMKLATVDDWIWDYREIYATDGGSPTAIPMPGLPGGQGGGPSGPPGGGGGGGGGGDATPLDPPEFSIPTGTFPITDFGMSLTLTNPSSNPINDSRILYSVNDGPWAVYENPLNVEADTTVEAYVESMSADWSDSTEESEEYTASSVRLDRPTIVASATKFDFEDNENIEIEIIDPNEDDVSELKYRIANGPWTLYEGPFTLNVHSYSSGTYVRAKAFATAEYYTNSQTRRQDIDEPDPIDLDAPVITTSAPKFDYDDNQSVQVTIINPNGTDESSIEYRVDDGAWTPYGGPFDLSVMDYQVSPATIQAKAVPTVAYASESDVVSATIAEPDPLFSISGVADGVFANAIGPGVAAGHVYTADGGHTFFWGDPAGNSAPVNTWLSQYQYSWDQRRQNMLRFTGNSFTDVSPGERFLLGTIDYFNGSIWSGTEANSVQLLVDLAFNDGGQTNVLNFSIDLINSLNTSDVWESADTIKLQNLYSNSTTDIQGRNYSLRLDFGNEGVDGFGWTEIDEFHVQEGQTASGNLYGTLWIQLDE